MTPALLILGLCTVALLAAPPAEARRAGGGSAGAAKPAARPAPAPAPAPALAPSKPASVKEQSPASPASVNNQPRAGRAAVGAAVGATAGGVAGRAIAKSLTGEEKKEKTAAGAAKEDEEISDPVLKELQKPFVYDSTDRRDPFISYLDVIKKEEEEEQVVRPERVKEPLEQFQLDSLKLVGLLTLRGEPAALVQDPVGKGYTVRVGNYMGTHEGKILNIADGKVELEEFKPTPDNPKATAKAVLKLHAEAD